MGKTMRALGLMSGTSLDGIDIALVTTDGEGRVERGPSRTVPYGAELRRRLAGALAEARAMTHRHERPGTLAEVENDMTIAHADVVAEFLATHAIARDTIDVIGFHGQTVLHRPEQRLTVQLGDGPLLARLTGIAVVYDMRAADVAAGGQGAPLVPVYHRALVARLTERPVAVVNIGGVANITWIGRDGQLIAFDTGPGNALIDDWMRRQTGRPRDEDGKAGLAGQAHEDVVRFYLNHSYFAALPPKSLDRNAFIPDLVDGLSVEDGAATLAAFTAGAIARAREVLPEEPELWIVTGGGRRNKAIMTRLAGLVHNAVVPAEGAGLDGDAMEAEAWAYLAVRSLKGMALTFPGTTGVSEPTSGGVVTRAGGESVH
ncbi:MAG: anhydro-N-acetylmuramic acid kinase [Hyphomicrobiaceae bacterium]